MPSEYRYQHSEQSVSIAEIHCRPPSEHAEIEWRKATEPSSERRSLTSLLDLVGSYLDRTTTETSSQ